jgi:hypothetical protein
VQWQLMAISANSLQIRFDARAITQILCAQDTKAHVSEIVVVYPFLAELENTIGCVAIS